MQPCGANELTTFSPRDAYYAYSADYAVARCLSVCLSVCQIVTRRYSVETAKSIINVIFTIGYSQAIIVFSYQTGWQ